MSSCWQTPQVGAGRDANGGGGCTDAAPLAGRQRGRALCPPGRERPWRPRCQPQAQQQPRGRGRVSPLPPARAYIHTHAHARARAHLGLPAPTADGYSFQHHMDHATKLVAHAMHLITPQTDVLAMHNMQPQPVVRSMWGWWPQINESRVRAPASREKQRRRKSRTS